ncbi:MAG: DegT/DnrJ/EryC1/StrS family aminotransferase [Bacteroidota bacterium]
MNFKIPLFELNFDTTEENAVLETLRSKWISSGPKAQEFEQKFATILNVNHALSVSNCTVALHLAFKLLDIKDDDEVICPSLTFVATINAIRYVNAKPVFCDVRSHSDLTIDPIMVRSLVTKKTKAIIVMHYGGFACDMDEIMQIAKEYDLKVIEDACHGPLSDYKGKKLGTIGDIGCFSFFSNKNISTGEGGMLITNNEALYKKGQLLRSHGMTTLSYDRSKGHGSNYDVIEFGYNYRIDDIRASLGIVQLEKLKSDLIKRAAIRQYYERTLCDIPSLTIPFLYYQEFCSNYIFPVVLNNSTCKFREYIRKELSDAGIQTSVHYPAVHRFSIYHRYSSNLPITEYVADNLITLPMFGSLTFEQIDIISDKLHDLLYQ